MVTIFLMLNSDGNEAYPLKVQKLLQVWLIKKFQPIHLDNVNSKLQFYLFVQLLALITQSVIRYLATE